MNKKVQRIASIVIGLIISGLLIYIGVRVVQKRATQASVPTNFNCERVTKTEAQCTWDSKNDQVGRIMYGTNDTGDLNNCDLVFISEATTPAIDIGEGNFTHSVPFGPLVADQGYCAAIGGNEDNIILVPAPAGGVAAPEQDPVAQPTEVPQPTSAPEPTDEPEVSDAPEPTAAPTEEPTESSDIETYYEDNPDSGYLECLQHFKSLGQNISASDCIAAYPSEE